MKKNLKKIFILFISIIASLSAVAVNAETIPESFTASFYRNTNTPISFPHEGGYNVIKTSSGKYVYCVYFQKYAPYSNITYTKDYLVTDNGMNYILNKAYSAKNDSEHFIYKSALWLYMVDKGMMPGSVDALNTFNAQIKNNNSAAANQIKTLVAEAKKASANDTSAPTITVNKGTNSFTLDSTGKYYVSNEITVTSSTGSFNVSLTSAPEGSTVEKTGNSFVVKVPVDKVEVATTNISFQVNNSKDIYTSYCYKPNNSAYQPLVTTFKDTKTASATANLTFTKVSFLKVDAESGTAISGAELQLTDSNNKVIKTWTSSTTAEVISGLGEGTYTVTETKAPDGYIAAKTSVKFSIDSKGNILDENGESIGQVVIKNEKATGGVSISKQDITNKKELSGAKLVVKDYDGNIIEEWISTNEPHLIKNLKPGIYTLTEIVAPDGYILSSETITFTVKDDGSITKVVMYNTPDSKEVVVENTASFKTITSSLIGSIILIAGSYIIVKNSKKKEA